MLLLCYYKLTGIRRYLRVPAKIQNQYLDLPWSMGINWSGAAGARPVGIFDRVPADYLHSWWALHLSISLGMISRGKVELHIKCFSEEWKNLETNSGPWSEITCSGTPCFENMCMMNIAARSSEVQWILVGMKIPCFESWSTATRIESHWQPEEVGRVSMKSMEMEFQAHSRIRSCFNKP